MAGEFIELQKCDLHDDSCAGRVAIANFFMETVENVFRERAMREQEEGLASGEQGI